MRKLDIDCDCCDAVYHADTASRTEAKREARAAGWGVTTDGDSGRCPRCSNEKCPAPCGRGTYTSAYPSSAGKLKADAGLAAQQCPTCGMPDSAHDYGADGNPRPCDVAPDGSRYSREQLDALRTSR
jgi:hypothetical protein